MLFGHHNIKLEEIEKTLNQAEYIAAKRIVDKHISNELKGKALLSDLRSFIDTYEKTLNEISKDITLLTDRNAPNRMLIRDKCKGNVRLARSQLTRIGELMTEAVQDFKE